MYNMGPQLLVVGKLFILMAIGAFLRKKNILPTEGKKILTDLIINLILPFNIVNSFIVELTRERLEATGIIFLIAVLIEIVAVILAYTAYRWCDPSHLPSLKYGTVCSNSGILGTPIAEGIFGTEGTLLAAMYCIPQRIIMWTMGVSFFTEKTGKVTVKKIVTHPCIAAAIIGMIIMVTQCPVPTLIRDCLKSVGGCNTAISMILVGSIIAEMDLSLLHHRDAIYFSVIRLVLIPLASLGISVALGASPLVRNAAVVLAAMPNGATMPILALKYGRNDAFASACTALSTVLSLVALPIWCAFLHVGA